MRTINEKEKLKALLKCVEKIFDVECRYLDNFKNFDVTELYGAKSTVTNTKYKEILIVDNTVINVSEVSVERIAETACVECLYQHYMILERSYLGYIGKIIEKDNLTTNIKYTS